MSFQWPLLLLTLLLLPLVLGLFLALERRRARYAVRFTNLEVLAEVVSRSGRWRRYLPAALFLLALAAALTALARPHARVMSARENASIVLAIDSSGSMFADDVAPTRLGAAQEAVRRFLRKLPKKFRVGLVTFSSEPQVVATLTNDRHLVLEGLNYLYPGRGTAIGDALARSVQVTRQGERSADDAPTAGDPAEARRSPPRAIVLLSDGFQTRGVLSPLQGAQRAKAARIPVYTVALGTPNGVINFGPFTRPVPPDPETLRQIAQTTGGRFWAAGSAARLNAVYDKLGSSIGRVPTRREVTYLVLAAAAALLVAAWALSARWAQRLP